MKTRHTFQRVIDLLKQHGCKLYNTHSKLKAALAERYVGRVKRVFARLFTHTGKKNWIDYLSSVQDSINNSYNRSIKMTPNQVNKNNESEVWKNLYHKVIVQPRKIAKYKVGDLVKVASTKLIFTKSYEQSYSSMTFVIKQVQHLHPVPVYVLTDSQGEVIQGKFYEHELQKVSKVESTDL